MHIAVRATADCTTMNAYTAVENELFLRECIYACLFLPSLF